jgi:methionyl-tRNA synthetase
MAPVAEQDGLADARYPTLPHGETVRRGWGTPIAEDGQREGGGRGGAAKLGFTMAENKFYLTTPIYYVNARPHIGHAYSTIVADVIARRHRLLGEDTFFLTGTDEHGQKIERSAQAAGVAPQQFADQVSETFRSLWKRMGILDDTFSNDDPLLHRDFIRTTEDRHKRGVQKLFSVLKEKGHIYLDTYTGQYCVSDEAFVEVPPGAPCPDCGRITETVSESNYYFRLSAFQDRLVEAIESDALRIRPETRKNEVLSFVRSGLKDLSISRTSFKWGIPVPGDESHVIYVWLDALANYMTAIGYGSNDAADKAKFEKYWPADLHLVGKEITRFHCVYWPAFLMAAELALPKSIVANGWLLFEESKMSKSRGNVVRTETILDAFGSLKPELAKAEQDLFGADVLRYFLLREIPFGQDGSFSFDALVQRYNADLANGYGNLVSRTLTMITNFRSGIVPACGPSYAEQFVLAQTLVPQDVSEFIESFGGYEFSRSLTTIAKMISSVDSYFSMRVPWKLAKSEEGQHQKDLDDTLYCAGESIRIITALLYPVMPYATARVWEQLGLGDIEVAAKNGELNNLQWGGLKPGTKLGALAPIFPRADKGLIQIMADAETMNATGNATTNATPTTTNGNAGAAPKLTDEGNTGRDVAASTAADAGPRTIAEPNPGAQVGGAAAAGPALVKTPPHGEAPASAPFAAAAAASALPDTPQIAIDDFVKIDLRVAQIVVAERIPKADKLLRLEVDLGYERRQILSGIAEWYAPEDLIGRRIVVIANLAPRKMRGLESHGMLLAASQGENGKPVLATFGEEIALGARLK